MKTVKKSFLFFCCYIAGFCYLTNQNLLAQKPVDSLNYYYNLTVHPKASDNLTEAFKFYEKNKKIKLEQKDTLGAIQDLRFMASIQKKLGFLYDSEASIIEALRLINGVKNNQQIIETKIGLYNHLGIIYREYDDFDKSLEFYDKALKIASKDTDRITIQNNKANIYIDQKKFDLAIKELEQVYGHSLRLNDKEQIARALNNLGAAQSYLDIPEALTNMDNALKLRKDINDLVGMYSSYKHLTEYYIRNNNKSKAQYYANKAYVIAKTINSPYLYKRCAITYCGFRQKPKSYRIQKLVGQSFTGKTAGRKQICLNEV